MAPTSEPTTPHVSKTDGMMAQVRPYWSIGPGLTGEPDPSIPIRATPSRRVALSARYVLIVIGVRIGDAPAVPA